MVLLSPEADNDAGDFVRSVFQGEPRLVRGERQDRSTAERIDEINLVSSK
jgi:hypothetical protein